MSKRLLQRATPASPPTAESRPSPEPRHSTAPDARVFVPPGLRQAPVLDLLCTHFVLTLTLRRLPRTPMTQTRRP